MKMPRPLRSATLLSVLLLCGCAAPQSGMQPNPADPLEALNRTVFRFNDVLDHTLATPLAKGYNAVTPQPVRTAVRNFFGNLGDVGNAANDLLQGRITDGVEDVMRVAINTLFGVGGLIDVATQARLPKHDQDFGLTLGAWGVPSGPYLVLPLFGPSSTRDATGVGVGILTDPTTYMPRDVGYPLFGLNFVSTRASLLGASNLLEQAALDKYSFVRDAYLQQRAYRLRKLKGDGGGPEDLPDYGDDGAPSAPVAASAPRPTAAP